MLAALTALSAGCLLLFCGVAGADTTTTTTTATDGSGGAEDSGGRPTRSGVRRAEAASGNGERGAPQHTGSGQLRSELSRLLHPVRAAEPRLRPDRPCQLHG